MSPCNPSAKGARMLVVQNEDIAPGGIFCRSLEKRGARMTIVKPYASDILPMDETGFDGLIVLGGPQRAFDDNTGPYFQDLLELMRRFDRQKKPVAGICLGCQLLARAYGGNPKPLQTLEFGFIQCRLTEMGKKDPVLGGVDPPPVMMFHEDTFDLPSRATLLMEGDFCRNQGFCVGNVSYGFQAHIEVDIHTAKEWIDDFHQGQIIEYDRYRCLFGDAYFDDLFTNLPSLILESEKYCARIAENWLALVNSPTDSINK